MTEEYVIMKKLLTKRKNNLTKLNRYIINKSILKISEREAEKQKRNIMREIRKKLKETAEKE